MRYTVYWTPDAEQELAALWLASEDRESVTSAAQTIDQALATNPEVQGESREENVRIMFAPPLVVEFETIRADRHAYVLAVWSLDRGR